MKFNIIGYLLSGWCHTDINDQFQIRTALTSVFESEIWHKFGSAFKLKKDIKNQQKNKNTQIYHKVVLNTHAAARQPNKESVKLPLRWMTKQVKSINKSCSGFCIVAMLECYSVTSNDQVFFFSGIHSSLKQVNH